MKDRRKVFSEAEVRTWCFQVFQGLAYMHQRGYFHRDLKPGDCTIKIAISFFIRTYLSCLMFFHSLHVSALFWGFPSCCLALSFFNEF